MDTFWIDATYVAGGLSCKPNSAKAQGLETGLNGDLWETLFALRDGEQGGWLPRKLKAHETFNDVPKERWQQYIGNHLADSAAGIAATAAACVLCVCACGLPSGV